MIDWRRRACGPAAVNQRRGNARAKKKCFLIFVAFLCVSQQGEFKHAIKNFLGEVHVKNF
jgi:hypothetical protein